MTSDSGLSWPKTEIRGIKAKHLEGVSIIFGVTGSVAAYKAVDIIRELIKRGAYVFPVMTEDARRFITVELLQWASGAEVFYKFDGKSTHTVLGYEGDLMVIAPATANTLTKLAYGITDNPVTLTAVNMLGLKKSIIVVPAMHEGLWRSPQVVKALNILEEMDVTILQPTLAENKAKFPETSDIVDAIEALSLRGKDLKGINLLITAGPTREWLDPVRFISNPSSGLMGLELAKIAYFRGAKVSLVHGPMHFNIPSYLNSIRVETAKEMLEACVSELRTKRFDAVILAAAPSDFRFEATAPEKIKSDNAKLPRVVETVKISQAIRKFYEGLLVGFAAETAGGDYKRLIENALKKLRLRGFDMIIANDVSRNDTGFSSEYNEAIIIKRNGEKKFLRKSLKSYIALQILDSVLEELKK